MIHDHFPRNARLKTFVLPAFTVWIRLADWLADWPDLSVLVSDMSWLSQHDRAGNWLLTLPYLWLILPDLTFRHWWLCNLTPLMPHLSWHYWWLTGDLPDLAFRHWWLCNLTLLITDMNWPHWWQNWPDTTDNSHLQPALMTEMACDPTDDRLIWPTWMVLACVWLTSQTDWLAVPHR